MGGASLKSSFCRPEFREASQVLICWLICLTGLSKWVYVGVCESVCVWVPRLIGSCVYAWAWIFLCCLIRWVLRCSSMLPVANQSPCHTVTLSPCRLQAAAFRSRVSQARIHFQLWWNVNPATIAAGKRYQCQHRILSSPFHTNLISGYMAPCYPVTLSLRGCRPELASPGQVAVNFVPRFACFRQFGTRNRARVQVECPLVPSRTAACTSLIYQYQPACLYFLYDFSNIK